MICIVTVHIDTGIFIAVAVEAQRVGTRTAVLDTFSLNTDLAGITLFTDVIQTGCIAMLAVRHRINAFNAVRCRTRAHIHITLSARINTCTILTTR